MLRIAATCLALSLLCFFLFPNMFGAIVGGGLLFWAIVVGCAWLFLILIGLGFYAFLILIGSLAFWLLLFVISVIH